MGKGITRIGKRQGARGAKAIWERDGGMCIYCGNYAAVIDHVVPISKGGPNIKSNEVCACKSCNYKKSNKLDQDMLTRGIFWLLQHGEDMSWLDDIK